jgi:hypothetical protein
MNASRRHRSPEMRLRSALMPSLRSTAYAAGLLLACSARPGPLPEAHVGCYRLDRPIGYSATGAPETADSAWYVVQLLPAGRVALPHLPRDVRDRFARRSSWFLAAHVLHLQVFNGVVGWRLVLSPRAGRFHGEGEYISDARTAVTEPSTAVFVATPESCAPAP